MSLLLTAVLEMIRKNDIHISNENTRKQLEKVIGDILKEHSSNGWEWSIEELIFSLTNTLGRKNAYYALEEINKSYNHELTQVEKQFLNNRIQEIKEELMLDGILLERLRIEENVSDVDTSFSKHRSIPLIKSDNKYANSSYSGSDMVATINIPGKEPVVFGELSNVSYSISREKVPVRSLGRVSMKGFTRGMRTISGILTFTMFDESIVYSCMKDLKRHGYKMMMDEMPLFDITITMANEYGNRSYMRIYGISTYTEGMVMSINDMIIQNVYEFFALDIDPVAKM